MHRLYLYLLFSYFTLPVVFASGAPPVKVRLLSTHQSVKPGQKFYLLLEMDVAPKWHIYWRNPGDSGFAPEIGWGKSSPELSFGELLFSLPKRYEESGLVNFIHDGKSYFLTPVKVDKKAPILKDLKIKAQVNWLMCKDSCVSGETALNLTMKVDSQGKSDENALKIAEEFLKDQPILFNEAIDSMQFSRNELTLLLNLKPLKINKVSGVDFFPVSMDEVIINKPVEFKEMNGQLRVKIKVDTKPSEVDGLFKLQTSAGVKTFFINKKIHKEK